MRTLAIAALALLAGCGGRPTCTLPTLAPGAQPFLWEVVGSRGSLVVLGTHQAAGEDDIPAVAWQLLYGADVFIAEADEVPRNRTLSARLIEQPAGESLRAQIGRESFEHLAEILDDTPPNQLDRLHPWVAFLRVVATAHEFPERGMSGALLARARGGRLAIEFLETWADQSRYLSAAIGRAQLVAVLRDYSIIDCTMSNRLHAYRAGDDSVFINEIAADEPIVRRIDGWHDQLVGSLQSERRAFVAIGIGQLLGPRGLLARFSADGYKVRRVQ